MRDGRGEDWGFGGNDRYAEYKERRIRGIRKKKKEIIALLPLLGVLFGNMPLKKS